MKINGILIAAMLTVGLACAGSEAAEPREWRTESNLSITFPYGQPSRIETIERRMLLDRWRSKEKEFILLDTEVRRAFTVDEKGTDGHVRIIARRHNDASDPGEILYKLDMPGESLEVVRDFLIVEELSDFPVYTYLFAQNGKFAFQSVGRAASTYASESTGGGVTRYAAFSAWSPRIPAHLRDGQGVIGVLAYGSSSEVLSEAMLVTDDKELGNGLAYVVDEDHQVAFVDSLTRTERQNLTIDNDSWSAVLIRLRFRGSHMDLYFPVSVDMLNYEMAWLPRGFRLVPLPPSR